MRKIFEKLSVSDRQRSGNNMEYLDEKHGKSISLPNKTELLNSQFYLSDVFW